jgi:small subunit ribosomal protein S15
LEELNLALSKETVVAVTKDYQRNEKDTGSTEVQVALLTKKIQSLTQHLSVNKKDFSARRGLLVLVGQRRKLLRYLDRKDHMSYNDIVKKLNLKK